MDEQILVGKWDCTQCGYKGISGEEYVCPSCGKSRDDDVDFYLVEEDAVEAKNKNKNPDWKCKYCDTLNSDDTKICISCGSQRDESNSTYFENKEKKEKYKDMNSATGDKNWGSEKYQKRSKQMSSIFLILFLLPVLFFGISLYGKLVPKQITITDRLWTTTIETQAYKTVREGDFDLPANARLVNSYNKVHHHDTVMSGYKTEYYTEKVFSHNETYYVTKNLGNGKFSKQANTRPVYKTVQKSKQVPNYVQVPIYKKYYEYDIDKWIDDTPLVNQGNYKNEISYATFNPVENKYKEKTRYTKYYVIYDMKNKKDIKLEVTKDEFEALKANKSYALKNGKIVN